ncbi:MAG TPA: DUF86 domain-containing protein [Anaerolineae bacterium]|nr:DUF86 domain-containing protein [Anaerolineae bacterium]HQI85580.1 DUF86 domain-containing protein [Anaerolineae bacterium]
MSKRSDKELLQDISEASKRIQTYISGITYTTFLDDKKTQDAVIRNLEIIGEATKNLSTNLRSTYSTIPWRSIARMRDRLIHGYFGVNVDIVWDIITAELGELTKQIAEMSNEGEK